MNTNKKERAFDCVKMKNEIQAKIYAETKNMNTTELLEYFNGGNIMYRYVSAPDARRIYNPTKSISKSSGNYKIA